MFGFLGALLMALLFVITPTETPEVTAFQLDVQGLFKSAATEAWGSDSVTEPFALIWSASEDFYAQTADQAIALLEPMESVTRLALSFDSGYLLAVETFTAPRIVKAPHEAPLYNIIPMPDDAERLLDPSFSEILAYGESDERLGGQVLGESTSAQEESGSLAAEEDVALPSVPQQQANWVEVSDSITGGTHCVAVFYGTVNSYAGPCARVEDKFAVVQQN